MRIPTIMAFVVPALLLAACNFSAPSSQAEACDRYCAINLATKAASDPTQMTSLIRATENGVDTAAANLWLAGATNLDIHGAFGDVNEGGAIVFGTGVGKDGKPAAFGLRIDLTGDAIVNAELITARDGEASLFASSIPIARQAQFDEPVPEAQRTSRDVMIAAANAYFDGIEASNGDAVPVTEGCNRIENGVQTTRSTRFTTTTCNSLGAFVYITKIRDRRFPIVDEERGVLVAAVAFDIPGGDYVRVINGEETTRHYDPRSIIMFEAFKVVDGKIALIEAAMRNVPLGTSMGW
jgi:hypothetical protein